LEEFTVVEKESMGVMVGVCPEAPSKQTPWVYLADKECLPQSIHWWWEEQVAG
jgi:hypothetical protein